MDAASRKPDAASRRPDAASRRPDPAAQAVYYALFRVIEVAELSGRAKALDWAQSLIDDPQLLDAFARGVRAATGDGAKAA